MFTLLPFEPLTNHDNKNNNKLIYRTYTFLKRDLPNSPFIIDMIIIEIMQIQNKILYFVAIESTLRSS